MVECTLRLTVVSFVSVDEIVVSVDVIVLALVVLVLWRRVLVVVLVSVKLLEGSS